VVECPPYVTSEVGLDCVKLQVVVRSYMTEAVDEYFLLAFSMGGTYTYVDWVKLTIQPCANQQASSCISCSAAPLYTELSEDSLSWDQVI
jgi:hypothetical protein